MSKPPWLSYVYSALKQEGNNDSSRWIQLATIGLDNTPRVRTVVFRGWSESCEMEILSDKRSQKFFELESNNNVEICWLFAKSKCQFRFRGTSKLDLGIDNDRYWQQLNDKTKSMWNWPHPGDHFELINNDDFLNNRNLKKTVNFILLKINITHVDQLILNEPIHFRRQWIKNRFWIEERINP